MVTILCAIPMCERHDDCAPIANLYYVDVAPIAYALVPRKSAETPCYAFRIVFFHTPLMVAVPCCFAEVYMHNVYGRARAILSIFGGIQLKLFILCVVKSILCVVKSY